MKTVTVSEFHSNSLLAVSWSWSRQALGFRFVEPWDVLWSQIRVRDATSGTCCAAEIDEGHQDQDQGEKNDVGMGEVAGWCSQISNKLKNTWKKHEQTNKQINRCILNRYMNKQAHKWINIYTCTCIYIYVYTIYVYIVYFSFSEYLRELMILNWLACPKICWKPKKLRLQWPWPHWGSTPVNFLIPTRSQLTRPCMEIYSCERNFCTRSCKERGGTLMRYVSETGSNMGMKHSWVGVYIYISLSIHIHTSVYIYIYGN